MNGKGYTVYNHDDADKPPKSGRGRKKGASRKTRASAARLGSGPGARRGTVSQAPGWQPAGPAERSFSDMTDARAPVVAAAAAGGGGSGPASPGSAPFAATGGVPPRQVYAKPRRRWPRVLRLVALFLFALMCGFGGYWFGFLQSAVSQVGLGGVYHKVVQAAGVQLTTATGGAPVTIMVIGSDRRNGALDKGDPGRSDTQMLVRLDPNTGSISMLSVPRDLWVNIPGHGMNRINVAYTYGGPAETIRVFKQMLGIQINDFIDVNYDGFIHIVDQLGGVYIDCDRRYYNPPGTGWSAINLEPGYQLMTGRQALQFVRFRHDLLADWGRMQRQQMFLSEIKRQASRWSSNVFKLPGIIKTVSKNTISNIDSVGKLIDLASLVFGLNTDHIFKVHIVGTGTVINGADVLLPSTQEIQQAVSEFEHPRFGPVQSGPVTIPRDSYTIRVLNGSGTAGMAAQAAAALTNKGFKAVADGNADSFSYTVPVVYATQGLQSEAQTVAKTLGGDSVKIVPMLPGTIGGMTVVIGSQYNASSQQASGSGSSSSPIGSAAIVQQTLQQHVYQDAAQWHVWARQTPLHLEMPTAWSPGMTYTDTDGTYMSRAYGIPTGSGKRAAFVVVGRTQAGGYWHIQATSWTDPPIMENPNETRTINGRQYTLFYQNERLHRVAWMNNGTLLWITNTLDDQISNNVMLGLATSSKPVKSPAAPAGAGVRTTARLALSADHIRQCRRPGATSAGWPQRTGRAPAALRSVAPARDRRVGESDDREQRRNGAP